MAKTNGWALVLTILAAELDAEEFRRWFSGTAYASDSGDQITAWVPSESIRRHITTHYQAAIDRALVALGRSDTHVRLIVGGYDEDDDEVIDA